MLNQSLKLNTKFFNNDGEGISTRQGFGEGLLQAGIENENVVALCADLKGSTKTNIFADKFPERFIEVGIAEQNMASLASGMASMGKIPFITSYAMFSPGRNWEQIRTTIAYNDRPVKIIGSHAGITTGPDGGTHQALEDIALMRVMPNMVIISPCDSIEARKATIACAKTKHPTYIRLTRDKTPVITTMETPFEIGKAEIIFTPEKGSAEVGIIATGTINVEALLACYELDKEGIKVKLLNLSTIKPLDEKAIEGLARETKNIITVEDHQVIGGMGGAVAELLSKVYPTHIKQIGIEDKFGQSGTSSELMKYYGIDKESIKRGIYKILKK